MRKLAMLSSLAVALFLAQRVDAQVGEKRPAIEEGLGKPSREIPAYAGVGTTCLYTFHDLNFALSYVGETCTSALYIKVDKAPLSVTEVTQLLQRNSQGYEWIPQPGGDADLRTYVRRDQHYTAVFVFGVSLKIDVTGTTP